MDLATVELHPWLLSTNRCVCVCVCLFLLLCTPNTQNTHNGFFFNSLDISECKGSSVDRVGGGGSGGSKLFVVVVIHALL